MYTYVPVQMCVCVCVCSTSNLDPCSVRCMRYVNEICRVDKRYRMPVLSMPVLSMPVLRYNHVSKKRCAGIKMFHRYAVLFY
jgi:hypothetical protein